MAGNPEQKRVNARSFDPDKGLPLIGVRPGQSVGKGAAAKACEENQLYDKGKPVSIVVTPRKPTKEFRKK